jgi:fructose/tagatose bisphosphate aldolase
VTTTSIRRARAPWFRMAWRPSRREQRCVPECGVRALGVGVVSRNTVDAAVEAAYETGVPVMLIASRRQVDTDAVGVGYVEGWSTEAFSEHVRSRDRWNRVCLCRDHGGPWQHPAEVAAGLAEREALDSALASFEADLHHGFEVLHIDTSASPGAPPGLDVSLRRLLHLYEGVTGIAESMGVPVALEIGCEDQCERIQSRNELAASTGVCLEEIDRRELPRPRYVVVQTGTKVIETTNVGELATAATAARAQDRLRSIVRACQERRVGVKAHNCDYLDAGGWRALADAGVDSANVAPEYGVVETRTLLALLRRSGMLAARDRFLELAYDSGKWRKWMAERTAASDYDRAVIAGHYVFSSPEVAEIRERLARGLPGGACELDDRLRGAVKRRIVCHMQRFGLV